MMARKNKRPTLEELPLASCAELGITSIDCEAARKRQAEVDAAWQRSKRQRKRFANLCLLDPAHFPDLDAMRAFARGPGRKAMELAIDAALEPNETAQLAPGLIAAARSAAHLALLDVSELVDAVLAGRPRRARREPACDTEENIQHARRDLLAFLTSEDVGDSELQAELLRYLGDRANREAA